MKKFIDFLDSFILFLILMLIGLMLYKYDRTFENHKIEIENLKKQIPNRTPSCEPDCEMIIDDYWENR